MFGSDSFVEESNWGRKVGDVRLLEICGNRSDGTENVKRKCARSVVFGYW